LNDATHQALFVNIHDRYVYVQVKLGKYKKLVTAGHKAEEVDFRFNAGDDIRLTYSISTGSDAKDEPQTITTFVSPMPFETSARHKPNVTLCTMRLDPASLKDTTVSLADLTSGASIEGKLVDVKISVTVHTGTRDTKLQIIRNAREEASAQIYHALILN
jgi:hypothetical protein